MSGRMQGRVALVTGAARGQGRSHAVRLAEEGADVVVTDLCAPIDSAPYPLGTRDELDETAQLVEKCGRQALVAVADVRERAELRAAVSAAADRFGGLDVVVANAGISPLGPQGPTAFFDAVSVNLAGVVNTVEAAFPVLRPEASIVCIGSMAALLGGSMDAAGPGGSGYAHAKRAVARFVHDLALQLAPHGIRVNAVHPGNTDTPMLQNDTMYRTFRPDLEAPTRADAQPAFGSMHRLPVEVIPPRGISEAVLFLASDESRYVTGQQLKVEAGALLPTTTSGAPG